MARSWVGPYEWVDTLIYLGQFFNAAARDGRGVRLLQRIAAASPDVGGRFRGRRAGGPYAPLVKVGAGLAWMRGKPYPYPSRLRAGSAIKCAAVLARVGKATIYCQAIPR